MKFYAQYVLENKTFIEQNTNYIVTKKGLLKEVQMTIQDFLKFRKHIRINEGKFISIYGKGKKRKPL